jgi:hypothetical protein
MSRFLRAFALEITMTIADYYAVANHETASQFLDQEAFATKYSAGGRSERLDFLWPIRFNGPAGAPLERS